VSDLPFDQLVRFAGTRRALERVLAAQSEARVLDVGGFPCTFARHVAQHGNRWRVETADMQEGALENYRRIAPGPLPYADGEFDAVVSNDTLEHVPPDAREKLRRRIGEGVARAGDSRRAISSRVRRCGGGRVVCLAPRPVQSTAPMARRTSRVRIARCYACDRRDSKRRARDSH
jgi:SAM-dependent methyltransferase